MLRAHCITILAIICISGIVNTHAMLQKMQAESQEVDKMQGNSGNLAKRFLNSLNPWRSLKIYFDLTELNGGPSHDVKGAQKKAAFYKKVFDITGAWWGEALWVRDSRKEASDYIRQQATWDSSYNFNFSKGGQDDYDLFVKTKFGANKGTTLAFAGPRLRHPTTQRPITGMTAVTGYGHTSFQQAEDSVNRAVGTMIHEFGHVIAFISFKSVQERFVKIDSSLSSFVWTGPIALEKARSYYGCSSLKGIPLQTKPGPKVGGHWSETYLYDELMTPTTGAESEKVSPMTLALCEDTGWYKANYNVSENFTYMKGTGCELKYKCPNPPICKNGSSGFITSDQKGIGYCSEDANGCAKEIKYSNRDCMKGEAWGKSYADDYGASYGGNCSIVEGKFVRFKKLYYSYSQPKTVAQAVCNSSMTSYTLTFKNFFVKPDYTQTGDVTVTCTKGGKTEFNTHGWANSHVNCQDPRSFCQARFGANASGPTTKCDESCNKNGRCQVSSTTIKSNDEAPPSFKCPYDYKPIPVEKPASNPTWKCWCYSNYFTTTGSCADLPEDIDF